MKVKLRFPEMSVEYDHNNAIYSISLNKNLQICFNTEQNLACYSRIMSTRNISLYLSCLIKFKLYIIIFLVFKCV